MESEEPADLFAKTNDDLAYLLKITQEISPSRKDLREEALLQMKKVIDETETMGRKLMQESRTIQSELNAYLKKPSEKSQIKVMQDALHLKNQMRGL
jgi:hypothetical protein